MFARHQRIFVLLLLTLGLSLSVVDRTVMALAGPMLVSELGLSPAQLGWLLSAFTWSYVALQLPAGWAVDRFGVRRTVLVALLAWCLVSLLAGMAALLAHTFLWLVVLRLLSGVFNAPIAPAAGPTLAAWFPAAERGRAGAVFSSASYLAIGLFAPGLAWLAARFGWNAMFIAVALALAALGALWSARFAMPLAQRHVTPGELELLRTGGAVLQIAGTARVGRAEMLADVSAMLRSRMVYGILLSHFSVAATTYFFIGWFPSYLVSERGMTLIEAGSSAVLPAVCGCVGALLTGWCTDALLRRTRSLSIARTAPIVLGGAMMAAGFAGAALGGSTQVVIALLCLSMFGKGFGSLGWTMVSELFPVRTVGLAGSLMNMVSNVAGIAVTVLIGYIVEFSGRYGGALWFMAGMAALGCVGYFALARRLQPLRGPAQRESVTGEAAALEP